MPKEELLVARYLPRYGSTVHKREKISRAVAEREREITSGAKAPAVYEADHGVFFYGRTVRHQITHVNCC
jgi:hypothetical protein